MTTWCLRKRFRFEASHQLPRHDGKCARLHGHSWQGELEIAGQVLATSGPTTGMVQDFNTLSAALAPVLRDYLDHYHLNDSLGLADPTSEQIARWLYDRLAPALPTLRAVTIEETCTSSCRYEPAR